MRHRCCAAGRRFLPRIGALLAAVVLVAGCSHRAGPSPLPSTTTFSSGPMLSPFSVSRDATAFRVIHAFKGPTRDGAAAYGTLIAVGGKFTGTTSAGGAGSSCSSSCGTVFSVSKSGAERVVYNFGSYKSDGAFPYATLLRLQGSLYGTTSAGGAASGCQGGCGTVFKIDARGKEQVVYSLGSYTYDGLSPAAGLTNVGGTLYGTTRRGGRHNRGTVFSISASDKERVIYSFGSYKDDGLSPAGGLTSLNGVLYGLTELGGTHGDGTLFQLSTSGSEHVLHSFGRAGDGKTPRGDLIFTNEALYGATSGGGTHGGGTIFISTSGGIEGVLHDFGKGSDGKDPQAGLVAIKGTLYGTTAEGGTHDDGTVFSLTTFGKEVVLKSFDGTTGAQPYAGLSVVDGVLYGTTTAGGSGAACQNSRPPGCGVVFGLGL